MRGTGVIIGVIIFLIILINLIVLVVADWIVRMLGMTGLAYYCGVILLWLILGGLLGVSVKVKS
jgi:small neutral amino acid transporter SnatA (MarC family)